MNLDDLRGKLNELRKTYSGEAPQATPEEGIDNGATLDTAEGGNTEAAATGSFDVSMPNGTEISGELPVTPSAPTDAQPPAPSYLTMDNFNNDFGQWFNNDSDLGEELFRQMNIMGVDTKTATEAALRNVLEDVVNRSRAIMQQLSFFISNVMQQTNQMSQMSAAVNNALAMKGEPIPTVNIGNPPPDEPNFGAMGEAGAGAELPPPTDAGAGGELPPPDDGGGEFEPPPDDGGGEFEPPPEGVPPEETPSDARIKNVQSGKYVVSDAQAKNIFRQMKSYSANGNGNQRSNILSAVRTGFN